MFIGEGPGRDEGTLKGRPFVGRGGRPAGQDDRRPGPEAGGRLHRQLREVPPPGQPHPTPQDSQRCLGYLKW